MCLFPINAIPRHDPIMSVRITHWSTIHHHLFNTLGLTRQNGYQFAYDTLNFIFLNENCCSLIQQLLRKGLIDNKSLLVQAWQKASMGHGDIFSCMVCAGFFSLVNPLQTGQNGKLLQNHFCMHFVRWKISFCVSYLVNICSWWSNWQWFIVGSNNSLTLNKYQAIPTSNDGLVHW